MSIRCASSRSVFALAVLALTSRPAGAFPPYRSTDADTADPHTVELRFGLVKWERDEGDDEIVAPLLRMNFGLPHKVELVTELEYSPQRDAFGDGAVGFKWVPLFGSLSLGVEALCLVPVRRDDQGIGVESQLVATLWREDFRLHVNAGGFHDGRSPSSETGWRASTLVEFPRDRWTPGIEIFAKQVEHEEIDMRLGVGTIVSLGAVDVRSALHVGVTDESPDVVFSLWISTKLNLL